MNDRGRYAALAKRWQMDARKFIAQAMKEMEELATKKYGESDSPAKSKWMYAERRKISSIARAIEREFDNAVKRLKAGTARGQDKRLIQETVIAQKRQLRAIAWERHTKDWTDEQKKKWSLLDWELRNPGKWVLPFDFGGGAHAVILDELKRDRASKWGSSRRQWGLAKKLWTTKERAKYAMLDELDRLLADNEEGDRDKLTPKQQREFDKKVERMFREQEEPSLPIWVRQ